MREQEERQRERGIGPLGAGFGRPCGGEVLAAFRRALEETAREPRPGRKGFVGEGNPLRALFLGFGNVGRQIGEILTDRPAWPGLADLDLSLVGIVTRSRGCLADPRGVDLPRALAELRAGGRFAPENPQAAGLDGLTAARNLDYDVLVEISTLNVEGRGHPAIDHVRAALERGRHAITANKGPVAWAHRELSDLAREKGVRFLKETTVMDAVPIFNLKEFCLRGCRIREVEGILNSTSNWVLQGLEEGMSLEAAVRRAQEAGIAEADPSLDLEGWDCAVKVAALANGLLAADDPACPDLTPESIDRGGVADFTPERVAEAKRRGFRYKMIGRACRDDSGALRGRVAVEEVPLDHPYALVGGTSAVLTLRTDLLQEFRLVEEGTTLVPTAYGVLSDLLTLRAGL